MEFVDFWRQMLAEGTEVLTTAELAERLGTTRQAVHVATHNAEAKGLVFSPVKGIYVLVPPEYGSWGVSPAERFIDEVMERAGAAYYVGYLSAASHHGAAHQAPQAFQVVTDGRFSSRALKGLRLQFLHSTQTKGRARVRVTRPEGEWWVASPETCLLDLADRPDRGGGVGNVLTIAGELEVSAEALAAEASKRRGPGAARRAGWVLSRSQPDLDISILTPVARPGAGDPTALRKGERSGNVDQRWWVDVNVEAEPDA